MNDYLKINHKKPSQKYENQSSFNKKKFWHNLVTRSLISVILVMSVAIYTKLDSDNKILIDNYIFKDNLKFTDFNNWYQKKFGNIIPNLKENSNLVMSSTEIKNNSYENYLDGVKIQMEKGSPISLLNGGIVVFIGEKDGYGNTLIIQGNDGIDYWYGGIANTSVNLYDYLEKDTLIGECENDYLYIVLEKDKTFLKYEDYIQV